MPLTFERTAELVLTWGMNRPTSRLLRDLPSSQSTDVCDVEDWLAPLRRKSCGRANRMTARHFIAGHVEDCGCSDCAWLTPFARLLLPGEEPTTATNRPTPERVQTCLDGNQRAPEAAWAARVVLGAREKVTSHARRAWAEQAWDRRADLLNGGPPPSCGCCECEWTTPIAKLILRDVDGGWAARAAAKAATRNKNVDG